MTVTQVGNKGHYKGLSTDDKPTIASTGALFTETDTNATYVFVGGLWILGTGTQSGGGITANSINTLTNKTMSYSGNTFTNFPSSPISAASVTVFTNKSMDYNSNTFTNFPTVSGTWDRTASETLTNKVVNTTDNTVTATSQAAGDILVNNGSKFVRKAKGTAFQQLRVNSGATDLEYFTSISIPSVTVWTDGAGTYFARNNTTGIITSEVDGGVGTNTGFAKLINDVMTSFGSAGGKILIKKGTYMVNATGVSGGTGVAYGILVPFSAPYLDFEGEGWGTILKLSDPNMMLIRDNNSVTLNVSAEYVRLAHMQLDGNKANTTMLFGISITQFFRHSDVLYENLLVVNGGYQGLSYSGEGRFPGYNATRCRIIDCVIMNCNNNSIDVGSAYLQVKNCVSINGSNGVGGGNNAGLDLDSAKYAEVDGFISIGDYQGIITGTGGLAGRDTNNSVWNNIIVLNPVKSGINLFGLANVAVNNVYVENAGLHGIYVHDGCTDVQLNNININGTGKLTAGGHGIYIHTNCLRTVINNTRIYDAFTTSANGIIIDGSSASTSISNTTIAHTDTTGIFLDGVIGTKISNVRIEDVTSLDGIRVVAGADNTKIVNTHVTTARNGFFINLSADTQVLNCSAALNRRHGFNTFGGTRVGFTSCISSDNGTSAANTYDGFNLDGDAGANGSSTQCSILGCTAYDSHTAGSKTQRYGVALTNFSTGCIISNCIIQGNNNATGITNAGTTNAIRVISGDYKAENSGQSTQTGNGSATAFNIAHGLSGTPKAVTVTAGSAAAAALFYVTTTSTNIVVNFTVAPTNGVSLVLNWRADLYS